MRLTLMLLEVVIHQFLNIQSGRREDQTMPDNLMQYFKKVGGSWQVVGMFLLRHYLLEIPYNLNLEQQQINLYF